MPIFIVFQSNLNGLIFEKHNGLSGDTLLNFQAWDDSFGLDVDIVFEFGDFAGVVNLVDRPLREMENCLLVEVVIDGLFVGGLIFYLERVLSRRLIGLFCIEIVDQVFCC